MQSIGLPTYCLVVTMTENVNRITEEMHLGQYLLLVGRGKCHKGELQLENLSFSNGRINEGVDLDPWPCQIKILMRLFGMYCIYKSPSWINPLK